MTTYTNKTLLLIGDANLINQEVIHHFLAEGVQLLRLFSGDEEGMTHLRDALAPLNSSNSLNILNQKLRFYIGDVSDPAYLEETMHGVDYVLYAPAMKSTVECEEQPAEACDAILNPVKNVIDTAVSQHVSRLVVLSGTYREPLTKVKSLIAALLEKVIVAQGRYLGKDSRTAIICARQQGELSPLDDFAFAEAANADLLVQQQDTINRIPCDNFDFKRE